MIDGFRRTYSGQNPYYEVWYGKVDISENQAFWFRYTLLDGDVRETSTWAILFNRDKIVGDREIWGIDDLSEGNSQIIPNTNNIDRFRNNKQVFHLGNCHLDESNAVGFAGDLKWDLSWNDSGRRLEYIPPFLKTIGLAKSNYNTCFLDLTMNGTIKHDQNEFTLDQANGMLGHIYGTKISGHQWGWSHCNSFVERTNAVFEGLSAELDMNYFTTPALSGFYLIVDDREYSFLSPKAIVTANSTFDRYGWSFETETKRARLEGKAAAPDQVALVEYTDTDASNLWCYNSKLADLQLQLTDKERSTTYELESNGRAAYEWVTRNEPDQEILVS